ncbi:hypothetical protein MMC10_011049 [Thelotrema lepadinum]|nr:hypothetical protein [Thelotrema lepadinum]
MSLPEPKSPGIMPLILLIALAVLIVVVLVLQVLEQHRQIVQRSQVIVDTTETEPLLPRWTRSRLAPSSRRTSRINSRRISRSFMPVLEAPIDPPNGEESDDSEDISPCTTPAPHSPLPERAKKFHYPSMKVAPTSTPPPPHNQTRADEPGRHCMLSKNLRGLEMPESDGRKVSLDDEEYIDELSPEAENDDVFKRAFAGETDFKMYVRGMDGRKYTNTPPF